MSAVSAMNGTKAPGGRRSTETAHPPGAFRAEAPARGRCQRDPVGWTGTSTAADRPTLSRTT